MLNSKSIGNKIAEARKKNNLSQAELAQQVSISPQAVGKWERGESMPDITTLNRLAEIFGVDLNYFSETYKSNEIVEIPITKPQKKSGLSWNMSSGNWVDADFSKLKNLQEKFSSSNMQRCKFIESDLSGLLLKNNNIDGCDFSSSDLTKSHIQGSNLVNNKFMNCLLREAEFSGSYIKDCNLSNTDLTESKFSESYIYGCDLTGCNLTGVVIKSGGFTGEKVKSGDTDKNVILDAVWNHTSFIDTHIADIIFTGTLEDCYFENCAFTRVKFQNATLINTFFKNNKKLKRIQFIDCKVDRMTYEFLKQGKADLNGITLLNP